MVGVILIKALTKLSTSILKTGKRTVWCYSQKSGAADRSLVLLTKV